MDEFVRAVPRRREHSDVGLERHLGGLRPRVVVGEVVDHLLDAHGVFLRQAAGVQRAPREAVGRGVDVDRERGDGLLRDLLHRVVGRSLELVAVLLDLHRRRLYAGLLLHRQAALAGCHGLDADVGRDAAQRLGATVRDHHVAVEAEPRRRVGLRSSERRLGRRQCNGWCRWCSLRRRTARDLTDPDLLHRDLRLVTPAHLDMVGRTGLDGWRRSRCDGDRRSGSRDRLLRTAAVRLQRALRGCDGGLGLAVVLARGRGVEFGDAVLRIGQQAA